MGKWQKAQEEIVPTSTLLSPQRLTLVQEISRAEGNLERFPDAMGFAENQDWPVFVLLPLGPRYNKEGGRTRL